MNNNLVFLERGNIETINTRIMTKTVQNYLNIVYDTLDDNPPDIVKAKYKELRSKCEMDNTFATKGVEIPNHIKLKNILLKFEKLDEKFLKYIQGEVGTKSDIEDGSDEIKDMFSDIEDIFDDVFSIKMTYTTSASIEIMIRLMSDLKKFHDPNTGICIKSMRKQKQVIEEYSSIMDTFYENDEHDKEISKQASLINKKLSIIKLLSSDYQKMATKIFTKYYSMIVKFD